MDISAPKGTHDILPPESGGWQRMEEILRSQASIYGYREVRTPVFEHTELFERGVGDTTDIVQKEMYTFQDKSDRSLTLRPEGTASCVRSYIEHGICNQAQPTKWYYLGPMFRYDRPQAGRYRQFHQFGCEAFGAKDPGVDAEVIALMVRMVRALGIRETELHLNTVGCHSCRPVYREKLVAFLTPKAGKLCDDCRNRYQKNPLRVLDCKNPGCQEALAGYPSMTDNLCGECTAHFEKVQELLSLYNIDFMLDDRLVRGLDYYTNTAFELHLPGIGAQSAVGGGGRYDGLIQEVGGPALPGIGFAMGLERLMLAAKAQNVQPDDSAVDVFVAVMGQECDQQAYRLLDTLRLAGIRTDRDYIGRSLKAQMKFADRLGARFVLMLGEAELQHHAVTVRDMKAQSQEMISLDGIAGEMRNRLGRE